MKKRNIELGWLFHSERVITKNYSLLIEGFLLAPRKNKLIIKDLADIKTSF